MRHSIYVTNEYSQSRTVYSHVPLKARDRLVSLAKFKEVSYICSWRHKTVTETVLDYAYFDNLIKDYYQNLRYLYSVPFNYSWFRYFVYCQPQINHYRYRTSPIILPPHNMSRSPDIRNRHGVYYRQGPKFTQHGIEKKVRGVSDQYQIDTQEARRDWREKKGFKRDKGRGRQWCKCRINDARQRRNWERSLINAEKYDDIYDHKDRFTSSWDCC